MIVVARDPANAAASCLSEHSNRSSDFRPFTRYSSRMISASASKVVRFTSGAVNTPSPSSAWRRASTFSASRSLVEPVDSR